MKTIILVGLVLAQIAILAWFIPAEVKARRRQKTLQRSVEQEMAHMDDAVARYKRAADQNLTAEQATALLAELHTAQIMLKERAAAHEKQANAQGKPPAESGSA